MITSCCVNINGANIPKIINVHTGIEVRKVVAVIVMLKITIIHNFKVQKTGTLIEQLFHNFSLEKLNTKFVKKKFQ